MGDRSLNNGGNISLKERFDEAFPYYLVMGMSYELYWDGRPELASLYRKADQIMQQRKNNDAWLQGAYIQHAVASVLNGKKSPYPKKPFATDNMTVKQEKAKAQMMAFMERFNKQMHPDA